MRRPRVVVVTENLPVARDHRVRKQAATLLAAGYDVSVVCRRDPDNHRVAGVRVYDYPPPPDGRSTLGFVVEYAWSWLAAAWQLARVAATTGFDALQVCGAPDIYFPLAWLARRCGKLVVYDQRDPSPETYDARFGRSGNAALRRVLVALERATHRNADHVLVVNEALRATAVGRGRRRPEHVTIVGNGPAVADVAGHRPLARLRPAGRHLCCWAGVMGPQDHVDLAVRAAAVVVHAQPPGTCSFAFIGDGDARPDAERLAARLGAADAVTFPGWLTQAEVFDHLASADLAVETNLERFVSPVKVMECMAFGVPVVAFDLPETRRVAGRAARYVPPGDVAALARAPGEMMEDESERRRMAAAGRRRFADRLAWEVQAPAYLAVYRRLLSSDRAAEHRGAAA